MAVLFQLVRDDIKEGFGAFGPSWKNERMWKPLPMVSLRTAADLKSDSVNC